MLASQLLRQALRRRFPTAEPPIVESLADVLTPQMRPWRMGASLFSGFGVLALIIALVGLYGLVSYGVTQRRSELGLRMALGAQRVSIMSLVVREGLGFVLIGIAVGTVLSLAPGHAIEALLYETSPYDPRVLVGGGASLVRVCRSGELRAGLAREPDRPGQRAPRRRLGWLLLRATAMRW